MTDEEIAIASFAATIGGQLKQIDASVTAKGTIPQNKIDPRSFMKNVPIPAPVATPPNPTIPPQNDLSPKPLSELFVPLPDDIKKVMTSKQTNPVSAPIISQPDRGQLEFAFVPGTQNKIPDTPREMFEYFDSKLDALMDNIKILQSIVTDIKLNTKRKQHGTNHTTNTP